jgi:hypothetical protein
LFPIAYGVIGDYIQDTWTSGDLFDTTGLTNTLIDNLATKLGESGTAQGRVNASVLSVALTQYNQRITIIKTNTEILNSTLNSALAAASPASTTSEKRLQLALAGETATEVVITKSTANQSTPTGFSQSINNIATANFTDNDINKLDFNALTTTIETSNAEINETAITNLATNPRLNIRKTLGAIDYLGAEDGNERNYIFFTNTVSEQQKGIAQLCIIDPSDNEKPYEFITGSYEVDRDKKFIVYISALGQTYTVKNLSPSILYKNDGTPVCTNSTGACTLIEYNDTDTGELNSTYYGSSNQDIIQTYSGEAINDGFCKKLSDNTASLAITIIE